MLSIEGMEGWAGMTSICIVRRSEMEECLLYTVVTCSLVEQICIDCFLWYFEPVEWFKMRVMWCNIEIIVTTWATELRMSWCQLSSCLLMLRMNWFAVVVFGINEKSCNSLGGCGILSITSIINTMQITDMKKQEISDIVIVCCRRRIFPVKTASEEDGKRWVSSA